MQYDTLSTDTARRVWDMAAHLWALRLPSVHALADRNNCLVSSGVDSSPCALLKQPKGRAGLPVTPVAGIYLAQAHRALSVYEKPPRREAAWQEASVFEAIATHERAAMAVRARSVRLTEMLGSLRGWIYTHVSCLRDGLASVFGPAAEQALHGAFVPSRLYWGTTASGIGSPDPCTGHPAWELARLAFSPTAVAGNTDWLRQGGGILSAYQRMHPTGLDLTALAATLRIAVLDLLCRPWPAVEAAWTLNFTALRTLLTALPRAESALRLTLTRLG
ncbi:hypothetical protein ACFV19_20860 [Streptomyces griseoluteus]|uniref:hypothetical protein n=1 Tax=Streptomyces griseoluteus TaxID=29306 RepID=UPI003685DF9B